ncbi:MAG: hypothetical protein JRJ29_15650 [Deltaproteobacteria bacterium]|nr:hypothetical protein [Deltaproteobacteria bacterium]
MAIVSYKWLMEKYGLEPEEAAVVEWQYGYCGGFHTALWDAISLADEINLLRLEQGFPIEVRGYKKFTREQGWWQAVEFKVKGG